MERSATIKRAKEMGFPSPVHIYLEENSQLERLTIWLVSGRQRNMVESGQPRVRRGDLSWFTRDRDAGYPVIES